MVPAIVHLESFLPLSAPCGNCQSSNAGPAPGSGPAMIFLFPGPGGFYV